MSPLGIPELVFHIGWFLPMWELDDACRGRFEFDPRNMVAAMQVNRLWRNTLTPLLWMVFDAKEAAYLNIPYSIIQTYSHHFRYANFNSRDPTPTLYSTRLRELDADVLMPMEIRALTCMNPKLESLTVNVEHETAILSLPMILEPLADLTRIELRYGERVPLEMLIQPLVGLTKLNQFELHSFHKMQPMNTELPQLNTITELILACEWHCNPELSQIVRCCPSLESLKIRIVNYKDVLDFPSADLSKNLRESCSRLNSIRNAGDLFSYEFPCVTEDDHLNLFNATPHLLHYDIPVNDFNTRFCDALLAHALTLETVHIYLQEVSEDQFLNAGRILSLCPNLASFLMFSNIELERPEDSLALFEQPWICPNLQELELHGFKPYRMNDFQLRLLKACLERLDQGEDKGQYGHKEEASESSYISNNNDINNVYSDGFNDDNNTGYNEGYNDSYNDEYNDSYNDGSNDGSAHGVDRVPVNDDVDEGSLNPISKWTRLLAIIPATTPTVYEKLTRDGWTVDKSVGYTMEYVEKISSRLETIFQDKVFDRVFGFPRMRRVTLERFVFVKTGHANIADT